MRKKRKFPNFDWLPLNSFLVAFKFDFTGVFFSFLLVAREYAIEIAAKKVYLFSIQFVLYAWVCVCVYCHRQSNFLRATFFSRLPCKITCLR